VSIQRSALDIFFREDIPEFHTFIEKDLGRILSLSQFRITYSRDSHQTNTIMSYEALFRNQG